MPHGRRALVFVAFVALDTDTTSRYSIEHRLVERGAVCRRLDGRELRTFQTLINPEVPIPSDVQQVHGINDGLAQGQLTIEHVLPLIIESWAPPTRCFWPITHDSTSVAIDQRCAITIAYERGSPRPRPRTMTPHLVLEVNGVAYVVVDCNQGKCKKTFRLE
jgi:hypothetical protein